MPSLVDAWRDYPLTTSSLTLNCEIVIQALYYHAREQPDAAPGGGVATRRAASRKEADAPIGSKMPEAAAVPVAWHLLRDTYRPCYVETGPLSIPTCGIGPTRAGSPVQSWRICMLPDDGSDPFGK